MPWVSRPGASGRDWTPTRPRSSVDGVEPLTLPRAPRTRLPRLRVTAEMDDGRILQGALHLGSWFGDPTEVVLGVMPALQIPAWLEPLPAALEHDVQRILVPPPKREPTPDQVEASLVDLLLAPTVER